MVDWDRVEKLRSRGWDWDRIAGDEGVDFHADSAAGDPGRALKTLYFQRRSRSQRKGGPEGDGGSGSKLRDGSPRWTLLRVSFILLPLLGIWFVLALVFPSPVGVFVTAIPDLALGLAVVVALLAFALLRATERWSTLYRNSVVVGLILGIVISGGIGLVATVEGCPSLTGSQISEPQGWTKAANPSWQQDGAPVFYFFGSTACPYCSASSWAIWYAFTKLGTVTGVQYGSSSAVDSFPNTPEIYVDSLSVQSPYVASIAAERHDATLTVGPTLSSCVQQAYVSTYDGAGSIPFVVINGQYVHVGTLVDPQQLAGTTAPQVMGEMQNQSGTAWNAISPAAYMILAIMVKLNNGQPAAVAQIAAVQQDLSQIH